jgi:hypothetical protein
MKALKKFVDNSGAYGPPIKKSKKPVFRLSAIFPVIGNENFHSRILFMGYWILKREILEIGLSYTLRDGHGVISDNIRIIRPGIGLSPKFLEMVIGKKININVQRGTALTIDLIP